jgi:hypothetical protein
VIGKPSRGIQLRRFRFPAERQYNFPFGAELDDHVRALIDSPNVVWRIDPHGRSESPGIQMRSDLADIASLLIEFKKPRFAASGEHKNVPLGIRRHAGRLRRDAGPPEVSGSSERSRRIFPTRLERRRGWKAIQPRPASTTVYHASLSVRKTLKLVDLRPEPRTQDRWCPALYAQRREKNSRMAKRG